MAALGFQPGTLLGIQRHYGDQLLEGIQQGGRIIEQGLKQITTKRQLEGLGATLSQLNPESPDYPQELIKVGAQFPFAMQDPRGQALMSIGAKAHAQWQQAQQVMKRGDLAFDRAKQMEEIRFRNRETLAAEKPGTQMVNLNDFRDGLPRGRMGLGTDETQFQEPEEVSGASPNVPLFGQKGGLRDIAADVARDLPGVDKMPVTQFAPMLRQERQFRQQSKMQEDRQAEQEKRDAEKLAKEEAVLASKQSVATKEKAFSNAKSLLESKARRLSTALGKERDALPKIERDPPEMKDRNLEIDKQHMEQTVKIERMAAELEATEAKLAELLEKTDALDEPVAGKTRIIERNGKKYEVDDETKQVLREVK